MNLRKATNTVGVSILIPTPLRAYAGGSKEVAVEAGSVDDALSGLVGRYPDLRKHLYAETGGLRGFVCVYLNDENVRDLDGPGTRVRDGDTLTILPTLAGG
ncbi:MAG TPA: MoaD/ThiS family protein [Longimicrobium sp.]|nr:MoaD/ThiS family protein [Longimicrobium sp.]